MTDHPSRECKRALRKAFPEFSAKNIIVRRGQGTAYSWVHARMIIDRNCECSFPGKCEVCRPIVEDINRRADAAVGGVDFGKYYPDDGSNLPQKEYHFEIKFREKVA